MESLSTMPSLPMPAVLKQRAVGQPKPPAPIISALFDLSFNWSCLCFKIK